jgi:ATP-binding cassette subfamily B protein
MVQALKRLLPYATRVRRPVVTGFGCVFFATTLSLISPWVLKYVIDDLRAGFDARRLGPYALVLLGLALADGGFRYLMRKHLIGASRQIEYALRNDFFSKLERLPPAYYHANRTGDLMSRATNDLNAVRMMVGPAVMYFASTALSFVIAVVIMLNIDARLTMVALVPLPIVTIATRLFGRAIHDRFERIQAQLADMSAVVQEALAGVRVVRAYRQEPEEMSRFRTANDLYVERNRGLIRLQAAFYPSLTLCFSASTLIVLWVGGRDVIGGRLTLGEFVAFSRYLVLLSWPVIAFGWVINLVQRGVASWERMLEVLDAPEPHPADDLPGAGVATLPATAGPPRLEIRHLTFRYAGANVDALHDVSFVADPGQTVAVVGSTGSGKSTLVSLLPRLYEPPRGTVLIDGRDVRDLPVDVVRSIVAIVPQEPFLFSDTVAGNIAFGLDESARGSGGRERVSDAARAAGLDSDIAGFTRGYETMVGERGITLSGGQKQRTAIARALALDAPVLVLDDALSSVDTATEEIILEQLRAVRRGRTCLIIAHRISTVRDADLIIVLDDGRVVERGRHDTLLADGGVYAEMYRRQRLEDEIAVS